MYIDPEKKHKEQTLIKEIDQLSKISSIRKVLHTILGALIFIMIIIVLK